MSPLDGEERERSRNQSASAMDISAEDRAAMQITRELLEQQKKVRESKTGRGGVRTLKGGTGLRDMSSCDVINSKKEKEQKEQP